MVSGGERRHEELVVRPLSMSAARPAAGTAGWLLASLLFLLRFRGTALIVASAIDGVIVLSMVGYIALVRPRMVLKLRDGELVLSRLRGDQHVITAGDRGRVVELDVVYGPPTNTSWRSRIWMILAPDGTVALRLNRPAWNHGELETVRTRLALPLQVIDCPIPAATARESYPGLVARWAVSWWIDHPTKAAILIFTAIMCVALVIHAA